MSDKFKADQAASREKNRRLEKHATERWVADTTALLVYPHLRETFYKLLEEVVKHQVPPPLYAYTRDDEHLSDMLEYARIECLRARPAWVVRVLNNYEQ